MMIAHRRSMKKENHDIEKLIPMSRRRKKVRILLLFLKRLVRSSMSFYHYYQLSIVQGKINGYIQSKEIGASTLFFLEKMRGKIYNEYC